MKAPPNKNRHASASYHLYVRLVGATKYRRHVLGEKLTPEDIVPSASAQVISKESNGTSLTKPSIIGQSVRFHSTRDAKRVDYEEATGGAQRPPSP